MVIDYERPMELTAAVQLKKPIVPFIKDTLFKNQKISTTNTIGYEKVTDANGIARLVAQGDPAYNVKKGTRSAVYFGIPSSKEKMSFTIKEYSDYKLFGQGAINAGATNPAVSAFEQFVLNNVDELKTRAIRLQELMCVQALANGKIDMTIDGKQFLVDFGYTSGATGQIQTALTSTAKWSDAASDPYANIRKWSTLISKGTGYKADCLILGENVAEAFVSNAKIKASLDNLNYQAGQLNSMANANAMFGGNPIMMLPGGIQVYEYIQEYTNASGSAASMIDKDSIVLTSMAGASTIFEFYKGTISRFDKTSGNTNQSVEYYSDIIVNEDGSAKTFQLEQMSLPIVKIPQGVITCKVL